MVIRRSPGAVRKSGSASAIAAAAFALVCAACSIAIDAERRQCSTRVDCGADLQCLDGYCLTPIDPWFCRSAPSLEPYRVRVEPRSILSTSPIAGIRVRVCDALNSECTTPQSDARTDASGIEVALQPIRPAYIRFDSSAGQLLPAIVYPPVPSVEEAALAAPVILSERITLFERAEVDRLLGALPGAPPFDARLGALVLKVGACTSALRSGYAVDVVEGPGTVVVYVDEHEIPNPSLSATSGAGIAVILNVPIPGVTEEFGYLQVGMTRDADALSRTVMVRPAQVTYVVLQPQGS